MKRNDSLVWKVSLKKVDEEKTSLKLGTTIRTKFSVLQGI